MRRLLPVLLLVALVAVGCSESGSSTTEGFEPTTTVEQPATTSTTSALPQLATDQYEGVNSSDVLLVEALIAAYNNGDGTAFVDAMGGAEQLLYYDFFGEGAYSIEIDSDVQAQSIVEWDHPLGFRWELRRCGQSEDLPGATQCAMYRYDPIADTEMHRFPVDVVLSVTTQDGALDSVRLKYLAPNWGTLTWKLSRWVTIFHPEDSDLLFNAEVATGTRFSYWDLHHSGASVAVLADRVDAWEKMTLLSQDEEFYDWVSEHEPEALDVMWPTGRIQDHTFFVEQATYWTRLVDEYPG